MVPGLEGREIEDRLNDAQTLGQRVEIMESVLCGLLAQKTGIDTLVETASRMITRNRGLASIDQVTAALGLNERTLERRFKQKLGLSPKRFSRIIRFQNFLNAAGTGQNCNILDTALSFGYYDQAHLIREFREFSGKTPLAFFGREHRLSAVFIDAG
jgi:methylphosphotriester-DNA--protein-cysteine methyltransferase